MPTPVLLVVEVTATPGLEVAVASPELDLESGNQELTTDVVGTILTVEAESEAI